MEIFYNYVTHTRTHNSIYKIIITFYTRYKKVINYVKFMRVFCIGAIVYNTLKYGRNMEERNVHGCEEEISPTMLNKIALIKAHVRTLHGGR